MFRSSINALLLSFAIGFSACSSETDDSADPSQATQQTSVSTSKSPDHHKNVLLTTLAAKNVDLVDLGDGTFELSIANASNFIAFNDIPHPSHGVEPENVVRNLQSKDFLEILSTADALHEMKHPDGTDFDGDGDADTPWTHHDLNASMSYFDSAGNPFTVVFTIEDFVSAEGTSATWIVRPHVGNEMLAGSFTNVNFVIDGWLNVVFKCGLAVAAILAEMATCEIGSVGTATAACIAGAILIAGTSSACACAILDYSDHDQDPELTEERSKTCG